MAEVFGASALPAALPTDPLPINDPALSFLGSFLQAVANADCGASWRALAPSSDGGANDGPIRNVFAMRAQAGQGGASDLLIEDTRLPALYLWRSNERATDKAQSVVVDTSTINALWLTPKVPSDGIDPIDAPGATVSGAAERRQPFWLSIFRAWQGALLWGYHPAWVAPAETNASGKKNGSSIAFWMRFRKLHLRTMAPMPITVVTPEADASLTYDGYLATFEVEDVYQYDPLRRGTALRGLQATITGDPTDPLGPATTGQILTTTPGT